MNTSDSAPRSNGPDLAESLARILRHEVGDFLQTIYASAAILTERLPPDMSLERRVVRDMRARAEVCRKLLDLAHDYVAPLELSRDPVDLVDLAAGLTAEAASRYPQLQVDSETDAGVPAIQGDARRLALVGELLLANACQAARSRVTFRTFAEGGGQEAGWQVLDDGPGLQGERSEQMFSPFVSNRYNHAGLNLAVVRKLVLLHGGRINAGNRPEGGFQVTAALPAADGRRPEADRW